MTIKAILFDLGNTLVYSHPEVTFQTILAEHGITKPLGEVADAMIQGSAEFDIEKHEGLSAHEFYTQWNTVQLKHLGLEGPKERKLAGAINSQWWEYAEFHVYSDVKETASRLKKMGLKLGIVTGGYEEDVAKIMPKRGLDEFLDVTVGVNTTGKRKPNPKAFKYALKHLKLKPSEATFVGDDFKADYEGAEKVGMMPILIKRRGSSTQRLFADAFSGRPSEIRIVESLDEIFEDLKAVNP